MNLPLSKTLKLSISITSALLVALNSKWPNFGNIGPENFEPFYLAKRRTFLGGPRFMSCSILTGESDGHDVMTCRSTGDE